MSKHKLNMLEPGTKMLQGIGILLLSGLACLLGKWRLPAGVLLGLAGLAFLVLLILLAVEAHQDQVQNEQAQTKER